MYVLKGINAAWEGMHMHVAAKEMVPVVLAIAVWGKQRLGCTVLCESDNMTTVSALKKGAASDQPRLQMHLPYNTLFIGQRKIIILGSVRHNYIRSKLSQLTVRY